MRLVLMEVADFSRCCAVGRRVGVGRVEGLLQILVVCSLKLIHCHRICFASLLPFSLHVVLLSLVVG